QRQRQEADADRAQRHPLGGFAAKVVLVPQAPDQCRTGCDLDDRVEAEAEQRNAARQRAGRNRRRALGQVPTDGQIFELASSGDRVRRHLPPVLYWALSTHTRNGPSTNATSAPTE